MTALASGARLVVEYGVAGAALQGGTESGDIHVVAPFAGGTLVAVVDALGHGPEAAVAAREAARLLAAHAAESPLAIVERCHEGLRRTRGAVMSLAAFDARTSTMSWLGVGNVDGILVRADHGPDRGKDRAREGILLRGGVVGYQLPPLRMASLPVRPGDTLVLATDGIRSGFSEGLTLTGGPQAMAESILARYGKTTDDALVLVARYLGSQER